MNALSNVSTFSSGAADFMTFGMAKKINQVDGGAAFISYGSGTYTAGKITGTAEPQYAGTMQLPGEEKLLLIDTCGDNAGVALSVGSSVVSVAELSQGRASAEILGAVRGLLAGAGWALAELTAVGVVNGPGSFTGMRTGLAVAKGLCEVSGLGLAAVSRLEVLADARALTEGYAVLDAGRGEMYVRQVLRDEAPREYLCRATDFEALLADESAMPLVAGDAKSARVLTTHGAVLRPLTIVDALPAVLRVVRAGVGDAAVTEANYVRLEQDIFPRRSLA